MEGIAYFGIVVLSLLMSTGCLFFVFSAAVFSDDKTEHTVGMTFFLYFHGPLWILFYYIFKWFFIMKPFLVNAAKQSI